MKWIVINYYNIGLKLYKTKKYELAIELLERSCELYKNYIQNSNDKITC